MKKNRIILSIVAAAFLCSESLALPSGGKFTHGTSGNIATNGNNMQVNGNGQNSVIQWGGGFSIGKGESVNFGGSGKNYLNISYGKDKSTIAGLLNGGANNVFLINPKGVIITKDGTINANKFIASTTPIKDSDMQAFATSGNYSPIFDSSTTRADIVNLGKINVDSLGLVGKKVEISQGSINGKHTNTSSNTASGTFNSNIDIKGDKVYLDADSLKAKDIKINTNSGGYFRQNINDYVNADKFSMNVSGNGATSFKKYATIYDKTGWTNFSNGWNNNTNGIRNFFDIYFLMNDIDMQNALIDPIGHTNAFNKSFDGGNYTLSNLNINTNFNKVGLFGNIEGNNQFVKNLNINGLQFKQGDNLPSYIGGFAGVINNGGTFSNIALNNTGDISGDNTDGLVYAGGFAGWISNGGTFSNIALNNIGDISANVFVGEGSSYIGGFAGVISDGTFSNIALNNIGNISSTGYYIASAGGFAGAISDGTFSNIALNSIGNIVAKDNIGSANAGGFAGSIWNDGVFSNIALNNIEDISGEGYNVTFVGGFVGQILDNGTFSNIALNNIGNISGGTNAEATIGEILAGGFAGIIWNDGVFSNIALNNIGNISGEGNNYITAGGFVGASLGFSSFSNIALNNIGNISGASYESADRTGVGGFAGRIEGDSSYENITINNIGDISGISSENPNEDFKTSAGGFAGIINDGDFSNIILNGIGNISGGDYTGGFAGMIWSGTFSNIALNSIGNINSNGLTAGGFTGWISNGGTFSNIALNNIGDISINNNNRGNYAGGFAGWISNGGIFSNIALNNIGDISINNSGINDYDYAGGFAGWINGTAFSNITLYLNNTITSNFSKGLFVGDKYENPISISNILNNIKIFHTDNVGITQVIEGNDNIAEITAVKVTDLNAEKSNFSGLENVKYDKTLGIFTVLEGDNTMYYKDLGNGKSIMYVKDNQGNVAGGNIKFDEENNLFYLADIEKPSSAGEVTVIEKPSNAGEVADIEVSDDMWDKTTIQNIINELIDSKYEINLADLDKIKVNGQEYLLSDLSETDNPFYQSFAFLQAFTDNTQGALNDLLAKYANDKDFKHYQEANNYVKNGADNFNAKIQQLKNEKVEEQLNQIKDNILALESIFSKWNIKITDLIANYNSLINAFIADKNLYNEKRNEFEKLIATEGFDKLEAEKLKQELLAMDKKLISDYEILSSKKSEIENNIKLANAELDLDTIFSSLNTINDKIEGIIGGNINTELAFNINKPNGDKAHGSIKYSDDNILANANLDLNGIKNDSDKWNSGGNIDKPENPELPSIDNGGNSKPENPELPSDDNGDNEFKLPETPADSVDGILFNDKKKKEDEDPLFKRHQEDEKVKMCLSSSSSLVNNICLR